LAGLTVIVVESADVLNMGMVNINRINNTDTITYFLIITILSPSNLHLKKGSVGYLRIQEHTSIQILMEISPIGGTVEFEVESIGEAIKAEEILAKHVFYIQSWTERTFYLFDAK
jgi:hypothetical protein